METSKTIPSTPSVAATVGAVRSEGNGRLVTLVILFGVALSAVISFWLWTRDQATASRTLETRGEVVASSTGDALSDVVGRLRAVGGLYESSEQVTQTEFALFVENLGLIDGLGGIGYMPIVEAGDVAGFEAEMGQVIPGYALFELDSGGERVAVGERAEYAPVQWFEPSDAFGRPHGFDSFSEPNRRAALDMARATGKFSASSFIRLVSEQETDGFTLYWPVNDPETGIVVGFTVAAMDLSELLDGHLPEAVQESVDWEIADITAEPPAEPTPARSWNGDLEVGGRKWMLTVTPKNGSDLGADPANALLVMIVGVLAAVIAGAGASLYRQRSQTRQELETLQELTRTKDQFLASVSHELRTPLTGVLGFAELLRDDHDGLSDTERLSMISNIATEATDLAAIIDDLLVAARSELDLLAVTRVPVAIRAQLAQVLEKNSDLAGRVEIVADPDATCRAAGDPGRVRQILRNLMSNANSYGGERIQVCLHTNDKTVQIQIADNGEGIPPTEWETIFEPYHRAHSMDTKPASLGIGLSVARHLAQLMGGNLTYMRKNEWSIFELELPAAGDEEPVVSRRTSDSHAAALQKT